MPSAEDELCNTLIEFHRDGIFDVEIYPEARYNHFGDRGVVDLYVKQGRREGLVYEFKSTAAVRQATGANQIVRQFNRMRECFFQGSDHRLPDDSINFELSFTVSDTNIRHIAANAEMYRSAVSQELAGLERVNVTPIVTMRPANDEDITPIHCFASGLDAFEIGFGEMVKENRPDLHSQYSDVIDEVS